VVNSVWETDAMFAIDYRAGSKDVNSQRCLCLKQELNIHQENLGELYSSVYLVKARYFFHLTTHASKTF
jgi:hypothetical protein